MINNNTEAKPKSSFLSQLLRPKVGIPLLIIITLLLSPFFFRASRLMGLTDPGEPFDVAGFCKVEITPEENAFTQYKLAMSKLKPLTSSDEAMESMEAALEGNWSDANADVKKWLDDNQEALTIWRKGTEKTKALYHQPEDVTLMTLLPVTQELRTFARLAILQGKRLDSKGEHKGAWVWYRAAFRSSRHSGPHGTFIERLIGVAIHSITSHAIVDWVSQPAITEETLVTALKDVQETGKLTVPTSDALKLEYLSLVNSLQNEELEELIHDYGYIATSSQLMLWVLGEPELCTVSYRQLLINWLRYIDQPLHERPKMVPAGDFLVFERGPASPTPNSDMSPDELGKALERSILAQMLLPATFQIDIACQKERARQAALEVTLSAEIFKRRHGSYPDKTKHLTPDILSEIPADPFGTKGAKILIHRNGDSIRISSVGENGAYDGWFVEDEEGRGDDIGFALP